MLTIITNIFGNNGKFVPQSPLPLRHWKKKSPVILCHISSRLHQEPLLWPESIMNVRGLAGLQSLSSSRHLFPWVCAPGPRSQACTVHCWQVCWWPLTHPSPGRWMNQLTFHFPVCSISKVLSQNPCVLKVSGSVQLSKQWGPMLAPLLATMLSKGAESPVTHVPLKPLPHFRGCFPLKFPVSPE